MREAHKKEDSVAAWVPPLENPLPGFLWVPEVCLFRLCDLLLRVGEDGRAYVTQPPQVDDFQWEAEGLRDLLYAEFLVVVGPLLVVAKYQQLFLWLQFFVDVVGGGDRVDSSGYAVDGATLFIHVCPLLTRRLLSTWIDSSTFPCFRKS